MNLIPTILLPYSYHNNEEFFDSNISAKLDDRYKEMEFLQHLKTYSSYKYKDIDVIFDEYILMSKNNIELKTTNHNYYETEEEFNSRKNKKEFEKDLGYEILLERKIIRDKFIIDEFYKPKSIKKIISEDNFRTYPINEHSFRIISNNYIVVPLKHLNKIKSFIIYAKISLHEYINNSDYFLDEEGIEFYKQEKLIVERLSETLHNLNHGIILHKECIDDIISILDYALICLESAYYEIHMGLDFYELYFRCYGKYKVGKELKALESLLFNFQSLR